VSASSQSVVPSRSTTQLPNTVGASSQSVVASRSSIPLLNTVTASTQSVVPSRSITQILNTATAFSQSVVRSHSITQLLDTVNASRKNVVPSRSITQLQKRASASRQSVIPSRSTAQPISSKVAPTPRTKEALTIEISLTFVNRKFHEDLFNKGSLIFLEMKQEVELKIKIAYSNTKGFISVTISGFRPGSIVSEGRLYFANSSNKDVSLLKKTLSDYGTGSGGFMVSGFEEAAGDGDDDDDDEVILGLNWWQIGVIISGVVVFILLVTVVVLCVSVYIINFPYLKVCLQRRLLSLFTC
jgi:hypothetical protein